MEYLINFLLSLGAGSTTMGPSDTASLMYSTTTVGATETTAMGTETLNNDNTLVGTVVTSVGTTVFNAANQAVDHTANYYQTAQYVDSLSEEQLASALEELGVTLDETPVEAVAEEAPKALRRHV